MKISMTVLSKKAVMPWRISVVNILHGSAMLSWVSQNGGSERPWHKSQSHSANIFAKKPRDSATRPNLRHSIPSFFSLLVSILGYTPSPTQ